MNRLKGKVGVVMGAALGLGRATCVRMAEEGAAIAVLDDEGRAPAPLLAGWVRHIGDYAYAMMVFGGMLIVALIIASLTATILRGL